MNTYGNKLRHIGIFCVVLFSTLMINNQLIFANAIGSNPSSDTYKFILFYGILAIISLLLLLGYSVFIKVKEVWMFLLFIAVLIVNIGYLALVISKTLEEALLANRISYLGSVFLPLCMLMTIVDMCDIRANRGIVGCLICISVVVFLIAASQGYLDWYYKEVTLSDVGGGVKLDKVYGTLHIIYPIYLCLYFLSMIGIVVFSYIRKKVKSYKYALIILFVVFSNIFVWAIEQCVDETFEFLSISYVISEVLLLVIYLLMQNKQKLEPKHQINTYEFSVKEETLNTIEDILNDSKWIGELTARELEVFKEILYNKKRKDIAEQLCVSENTIKKHTSHIFSKLEVKNRTELFEKLNIK